MLTIFRNLHKLRFQRQCLRCISSSLYMKTCFYTKLEYNYFLLSQNSLTFLNIRTVLATPELQIRYFSKKKGSKRNIEVEDEEESDDESEEEHDDLEETGSFVKKSVPSLRIDTLLKAGLNITKKKIEKGFYASKIRVNGERATKKAATVLIGDEIDFVKFFSPENEKFLLVDRVIIKSIGKMTGTGMYPVTMEALKGLTIQNYSDPWKPSTVEEID